MKFKIFYSWQSDLPNNTNRSAIENAITTAIKNISKDEFELAIALDRDTLGLSGSPGISEAIFQKISECQIFICDISIINLNSVEAKKHPNPNVLLELGFAMNVLPPDAIIRLFNTNYGRIEDLPFHFHLKENRITTYKISETERNSTDLKSLVKGAIQSVIDYYKKQNAIYVGRGFHYPGETLDNDKCIEIIQSLTQKVILRKGKYKVRAKAEEIPTIPEAPIKSQLYFAVPSHLGEATFECGGLDGPTIKLGSKIQLKEEQFNGIEYDLYRTWNTLGGGFDFTIKWYDLEH